MAALGRGCNEVRLRGIRYRNDQISSMGISLPAGSILASAQVNSRFSVYASIRRSRSHTRLQAPERSMRRSRQPMVHHRRNPQLGPFEERGPALSASASCQCDKRDRLAAHGQLRLSTPRRWRWDQSAPQPAAVPSGREGTRRRYRLRRPLTCSGSPCRSTVGPGGSRFRTTWTVRTDTACLL